MKLTTDKHEASRGLSVTAEILVSPYGSPIIPVLLASNIFTNSDEATPCGALNIPVGYKNVAIFDK